MVSILAANPSSSRAAQELLRDLFSIEPITFNNERDDELDQMLKVPMFSRSFDSAASKCPSSGTVLHFLSLTSPGGASVSTNANQNGGRLSLLAITDSSNDAQNDACAVAEARRLLASNFCKDKNHYVHSLRLVMNHAAGRPSSASSVTRLDGGLPLLNLPKSTNEESLQSQRSLPDGLLKEIAIPVYDDAVYSDGQSLLSVLGSSSLKRPALGLYQWPGDDGVVIRPLPSAMEDRSLPPPSLVFYCNDLEEATAKVSSLGGISAKIGHNGLKKSGQLMISHQSLLGLDIRLTDTMQYASSFPEAQEALLASSLEELQNVNVCRGGGGKNNSVAENKTDQGDCWGEFRANMKHPSGYLKRATKSGRTRRIAKVPDLPYE